MPCTRPFLTRVVRSLKSAIVPVGCGKCPYCLQKKQRELALRMQYDLNSPRCYDSIFLTLTYNDNSLEYNVIDKETGEIFSELPSVNKETIQKYLKRVRKMLHYDPDKTQLLYYFTGEYCPTTFRPHYHAIIYLLGERTNVVPLSDALLKNWHYCDWNPIRVAESIQSTKSEASNMYVAKHQVKRCKGTNKQAPYFQLRSKGIGSEFFEYYPTEVKFLKENGYLYLHNKYKVTCPRYYAEKLGLTHNYYIPSDLQDLYKTLQNIDFQEQQEINKYLSERYYENPALSHDAILKEYFKNKVKKEQYKDTYFDYMYKKKSMSNKNL